jgi:FlaG/FlaF family flagellin (archaellin)
MTFGGIAFGVGAIATGVGGYLSGKGQAKAGKAKAQFEAKKFNELQKANQWTQFLGLQAAGKFGPQIEQANQAMLQKYGQATQAAGATIGVAQQGGQQALQQLQGIEQGAISQALEQQQAQLGATGQQAAAAGFGGSIAQGQAAQVYSNTTQDVANILAQTGAMKTGVIQQTTQNTLSSILSYASALGAEGQAQQVALQNQYALFKDKLQTILSTPSAWGYNEQVMSTATGSASFPTDTDQWDATMSQAWLDSYLSGTDTQQLTYESNQQEYKYWKHKGEGMTFDNMAAYEQYQQANQ